MKAAAIALAVLLAGCGTRPVIQTVNVPLPVPCQEIVPDRPTMPTKGMQPGTQLFVFITAAQAEIERREGYEGRLRTALLACTKPFDAPGP